MIYTHVQLICCILSTKTTSSHFDPHGKNNLWSATVIRLTSYESKTPLVYSSFQKTLDIDAQIVNFDARPNTHYAGTCGTPCMLLVVSVNIK